MKLFMYNLYKGVDQKYPFLGYLIRRIKYKKLFNTIKRKIHGKNNSVHYQKSILSSVTIEIKGNNNKIEIAASCYLNNVVFYLQGDNHSVSIGDGVRFNRGGILWMEDDNGIIQIGKNSTFEDVHLAVTESGSHLQIGEDCMFAYDIDVRTGDSHSIINQDSKARINHAKNINIGNHVWVASHISILKGAVIPKNCVIATRSVITKKFDESNSVIAGIPGKIVKRKINWLRERTK